MRKSVRQLARELNVSDRVLNVILRNKGYLSGEPGNYEPTSKGLPFVEEHENSHGNGGYSHMNKSEIIRRWDDSIMDEPDMAITDEDIAEAYDYLSERNRLQREKRRIDSETYRDEHYPVAYENDEQGSQDEDSNADSLWATLGILVLIGAGIKWLAPRAKNVWNEKVAPKIESKVKKEKCPKCDSKMQYDKKRNCWKCKKCGAVKQSSNNTPDS